jgi:pimeloyl-ACP methyl ester carboxylesterase
MQRYCVYNEFVTDITLAPVFFYTGNESPLEQYINNTGLMWELAETFQAQVVFVEHRYEGKSLPSPHIANCMAYSSSIQALADFASFIEKNLFGVNSTTLQVQRRPVIAFGGSYGGMLSAWLRMKYPNTVAGAIAASAPIWGFPRNFPSKIDTAWQVVARGLERSYPPTEEMAQQENHCVHNLLAAWPLIKVLGRDTFGRNLLTHTFRLCETLEDADTLLMWAQSPWFDFAEGSFPYPSSYIPFALMHKEVQLPAWPLQASCWDVSRLHEDIGIRITGNLSDVRYNITYGDSGIVLFVDWDQVTIPPSSHISTVTSLHSISGLLESVRDAVAIWFNVTKDVKCYTLTAAPNKSEKMKDPEEDIVMRNPLRLAFDEQWELQKSGDAKDECRGRISKEGSWPALCCNEEMNLIITEASGLGRDMIWPPSHPRGTSSHSDIIAFDYNGTGTFCRDPEGIYGFPQDPSDPWSTWMDIVYGGTRIESHSNIVFSNGLLDPWSAAGVYSLGMDPSAPRKPLNPTKVPGLYLQNITAGDDSMIALIMEYGGHHTDLMYSDRADPPCVSKAREIEKEYIERWIEDWWRDNRS